MKSEDWQYCCWVFLEIECGALWKSNREQNKEFTWCYLGLALKRDNVKPRDLRIASGKAVNSSASDCLLPDACTYVE